MNSHNYNIPNATNAFPVQQTIETETTHATKAGRPKGSKNKKTLLNIAKTLSEPCQNHRQSEQSPTST